MSRLCSVSICFSVASILVHAAALKAAEHVMVEVANRRPIPADSVWFAGIGSMIAMILAASALVLALLGAQRSKSWQRVASVIAAAAAMLFSMLMV